MTKLEEIEKLYSHLEGFMREVPHNANTLWLINRVKTLEEALKDSDCECEVSLPTNDYPRDVKCHRCEALEER